MGFISGIWEKRSTLANPGQWLIDAFAGGATSKAGVRVNEETALTNTAVYACVRIIAETVASLPLFLYRRLDDGGKEKATTHPLFPILHDAANDEMTSFQWRETMMCHLLLWGNAYSEIEYNQGGNVRALWPIPPWRVKVERDGQGMLQYRVYVGDYDTEARVLPASQVLHIPGLSFNGLVGHSPIAMAREAIGLGLAAQEFGARFFSNGAQIGGVLEHPGSLSDKAQENLRRSFEETHQGLSRAHRLMILEEGMKYAQTAIPPQDAQFLETRKFQVTEIARFFRVPPHMLADLERATFSNIEQQSIEFVTHTIRPWLVRWEQALKLKLITNKQFFPEFLVDGLLRGDVKSRYEAYAIARQNGWMNVDEIREKENLNPLPDGQGKTYLVPLNMVPADQAGQGDGQAPAGETGGGDGGDPAGQEGRGYRGVWEQRAIQSAESRRRVALSYRHIFVDVVKRILRREEADVMRAAKKMLSRRDAQSFDEFLDSFYREHEEYIRKQMLPVLLGLAEAIRAEAANEIGTVEPEMSPEMREFVEGYLAAFIVRYIGASVGQIRQLLAESIQLGEDPIQVIQQRFDEWRESRPDKVANRETVQAGNAFAKATYLEGGVQKLRWASPGKDCKYCSHLDGKVIGINSSFVEKGEDFQPEGTDTPMKTRTNISHPPLHRGCDCVIMPVI